MRTALDTNILSSLWLDEPRAPDIAEQLGEAEAEGGVVVAGVVYSELIASPYTTEAFVAEYLQRREIAVDLRLVDEVWGEAGRRFGLYARRRQRSGGGEPKRMLADFIVGAHALLQADRLMTLDPERYRQDFPELRIF